MQRLIFLVSILALLVLPASAEQIALKGGKIYTLAGEPIENGVVLMEDGKIVSVTTGENPPAGASVIDASGLQIYPGLFDAVSQLGLTEIGSVRATNDANELGDYTPHLKAATAIHPASELIPVARANGITHTAVAPGGGRRGGGSGIKGQAAVVHTAGWTVEEMAIHDHAAMILSWPGIRTREFDFSTFTFKERKFREAKKEYEEKVDEIKAWLEAGRHYAQAEPGTVERDLALEALGPVVRGEQPVIISANDKRSIEQAVEFAEEHGLKMILASAREGWKAKELLAEKDIPVILGPTQSLPTQEDDPHTSAYTNAAHLHEAGVRIAFGTFGASNSRTLPYEAGTAVAYGLPWDVALAAITKNAAEFMGLGDQIGTIEPGKIANLVVTDGDPLEIRTQVKHVFVGGQEVSLDNKHLRLYEKYRARQ